MSIKKSLYVLIILSANTINTANSVNVNTVLKLGVAGWQIAKITESIVRTEDSVRLPIFKDKFEDVLENIKELSDDVKNVESSIFSAAELAIERITGMVQDNTNLNEKLSLLSKQMHQITMYNGNMASYSKNISSFENQTLDEFATLMLSHGPNGITGLLESIHLTVTGSPDIKLWAAGLGIFEILQNYLKKSPSTICSFRLSEQQILHHLHQAISISELKGFSVMQFSWMILNLHGKGNFTTEAEIMRQRFEARINRTHEIFENALHNSKREIWRCDPTNGRHVEGETYLQITNLLQGYIENEVDMSDNTCGETCSFYSGISATNCKFSEEFCSKQKRCNGKIHDCKFIESDMEVCLSHYNKKRRYEYIKFNSGKMYGEQEKCQNPPKAISWTRWLVHCSYCFCKCDDAGPSSDRYINMREVISDVFNNKVVTGLRFVKKNRIIYLQIQEAELLPKGNVDNNTLEWIEPDNYNLLDANVQHGVDYYQLSYNNRSIDLDDIFTPLGHVVTGFRFRENGRNLNLELGFTKMDFETGKLIDPHIYLWQGNYKTVDQRNELLIQRPDVPIKTKSSSTPLSNDNQFLMFRASDDEKDAAQTTVPYFDAQPCTSLKPTALSGIGLFYKGSPGYGGFVTPKIFTYDMRPVEVQARRRSFKKSLS